MSQYTPQGLRMLPPVVKNLLIINLIVFLATMVLERYGFNNITSMLALNSVATGRFRMTYSGEFFNEFCVDYDGDAPALLDRLAHKGILGGVALGPHTIMMAVTEKRTKEEIDRLIEEVKE